MEKYNIALIGSFDVENYGDLLFENIFSFQIQKVVDIENIDFFAPKKCKKPFENDKQIYSVTELEELHIAKPYDAIIVGGGDLIHFHKIMTNMPHISNELVEYEALYMWLAPLFTAVKYNIPLIWNAPGVPFEFNDRESMCVKAILDVVDYICVRDEESRQILLSTGTSKNISVCIDTVLSIRDVFQKDTLKKFLKSTLLPIEDDEDYIVFHGNVNYSEEDIKVCSDILLNIKNTYNKKIVLLPIGYALGDLEILEKISNHHPNEFIFSKEHFTIFQTISLISNAAAYIGSSLHGLITATSYEIPSIVINNYNAVKIKGFLDKIERDNIMITDVVNLWDKYIEIKEMDFELEKRHLDEISSHFKNISGYIKKSTNNKKVMPFGIALMDMMSEMNQMGLKENHIHNLEKQNEHLTELFKQLTDDCEIYKKAIEDKENHINNITNDYKNKIDKLNNKIDMQNDEILMYKDICNTRFGKFAYKLYMKRKGEK